MCLENETTMVDAGEDSAENSQSSTLSVMSKASISSTSCRDPISQLTLRDRASASSALKRSIDPALDDDSDADVLELRRELQVMLMLGVKTEIQWLDDAGSLTEWLDQRLRVIIG